MRISLLLLSLCLTASVANAQPAEAELHRCRKPKHPIKIEFTPELELGELVRWASAFSCESIVVSGPLATRKLRVSVVAPEKMSASRAWSLFQIALRAMGVALVSKSGVKVVVEAAEAKGHALPLMRELRGSSRGLARALVSAEFLSSAELAGVATALKSKSGVVTPLAGTELVLVTDYKDHIDKMAELLAEIDHSRTETEGVYVISVAHADVAELATTITAILGAGPGAAPQARGTGKGKRPASSSSSVGGGPRSVIADARTRSLIMIASRAEFTRASALIRRLDVRTDEQASHIHMVALEHADAQELAATLNALLGTRPDAALAGGKPSHQNELGELKVPRGAVSVDGDVRITHDSPTNSLLVSSTMSDFHGLREIIRRLDSTRPQVYIEASIMEVSVTGDRDVGGSFHFGGEGGGGRWLAGLQQDELKSTNLATLVGATGLLGGLFGKPLEGLEAFKGQTIPSFGILFQALATSRRANVLSSPRIMTTDNTSATIKISEKRREAGTVTVSPTGSTTQSPETLNASLILKVTPHVNATDEVKLEIELTLEEFLPSRTQGLGSDSSSREISNTVVVRDQESVIIGGLLVEREINTESKVPLIGDIPIIGHLFKSTRHEKEKRNLLVLLTPYVLDSRNDHDHVVRKTLAERSEFMRAHLNLQSRTLEPKVDYRKKRGLLEAINQRAAAVASKKAELSEDGEKDGDASREVGPF